MVRFGDVTVLMCPYNVGILAINFHRKAKGRACWHAVHIARRLYWFQCRTKPDSVLVQSQISLRVVTCWSVSVRSVIVLTCLYVTVPTWQWSSWLAELYRSTVGTQHRLQCWALGRGRYHQYSVQLSDKLRGITSLLSPSTMLTVNGAPWNQHGS